MSAGASPQKCCSRPMSRKRHLKILWALDAPSGSLSGCRPNPPDDGGALQNLQALLDSLNPLFRIERGVLRLSIRLRRQLFEDAFEALPVHACGILGKVLQVACTQVAVNGCHVRYRTAFSKRRHGFGHTADNEVPTEIIQQLLVNGRWKGGACVEAGQMLEQDTCFQSHREFGEAQGMHPGAFDAPHGEGDLI